MSESLNILDRINFKSYHYILLFLLVFILRIPSFFIDYLSVDELSDFLLAKEAFYGGQLFIDHMQVRYISFYYYLLSIIIFGDSSTIGLHIQTSFLFFICAIYIYNISNIILKNKKYSFLSGVIYLLTVSLNYPENTATMLEHIANFFILPSILIFIYNENRILNIIVNRLNFILIGILIFIAGLAKQTAFIFLLFPIVYYLIQILLDKKVKLSYILSLFFIILGFILSFFILYLIHNYYNIWDLWLHYFFYTSSYYYIPFSQQYTVFETIVRFLEVKFYSFINQPIIWISLIFFYI